jgi:DNA-directed RNA polymerase subunit M/transcription elongation factor TFIIS
MDNERDALERKKRPVYDRSEVMLNSEVICPICGNDEVYYENPRTGAGCYVCHWCEHEFDIRGE